MQRYIGFGALAVCMLFAPFAWGQGNPRTRELQAQLDEIQQKLRDAARSDEPNSKVTELGSSRARLHEVEAPRLVIRLYDLSDLFAVAPPYVAREGGELDPQTSDVFADDGPAAAGASPSGGGGFGGGMGGGGFGGGGGLFDVPETIDKALAENKGTQNQFGGRRGNNGATASGGPRTSMDGLIDVITATISPDAWDSVGGPSSIGAIGASLLISADAETHDKISSLLDLFRKRWGSLRTVSVRAHWLWLSEATLSEALAADHKAAGAGAPYGVVSDETWKKLLAAGEGKKRTPYHAMLTCHNGQTVFTRAGGERLIVSGITPIAGRTEKEQALYQPVVRSIQEGAALQITPLVTRNSKYVVLDVHSRVNLFGETSKPAPKEEPKSAASPLEQIVAAIDRPELQTQRLATTLRIPVGRPSLIGGMTFSSDADGPANLYLFVTASVQELRDDEGTLVKPDEKPVATAEKKDGGTGAKTADKK